MAKELVKIQENLSILKCLNIMRIQAENINRVHSIYVVDSNNKLLGRLSLKDLLTANSKAKIKDIYIPKVDYVFVDQEVDQVAKIMFKYDLEAIPVINKKRELLGRITIDDVVDLTKEEAEKDYQLASGISNDVEANDSIYELTKARFPWLFLGLIGGLGSVFILQDFEEVMNSPELRSLFFYTPLIAAMAGNVGVQSSAIIVQGIANDVLRGSIWSRLLKADNITKVENGIINNVWPRTTVQRFNESPSCMRTIKSATPIISSGITNGTKINESEGFFPKNSYREFALAVRTPSKVPRPAAVTATNNEFFRAA